MRPNDAHAEALQFPVLSNGVTHLYVWGDASAARGLSGAEDAYTLMDYRLQDGSPCIDTGMVPWWDDGEADIQGAPRPWLTAHDMGAYEAESPLPPPLPDPLLVTSPHPEGLLLRIR